MLNHGTLLSLLFILWLNPNLSDVLLERFFVQMVTKTKKIFVGGLSATATVEDVKGYFEQFGKVMRY